MVKNKHFFEIFIFLSFKQTFYALISSDFSQYNTIPNTLQLYNTTNKTIKLNVRAI